jgi:hypothetical protein
LEIQISYNQNTDGSVARTTLIIRPVVCFSLSLFSCPLLTTSIHRTWLCAVADDNRVIASRRWCLWTATCLVCVVCDVTPRVALHRSLCKGSRQLCPVLSSINTNQPAWVGKVCFHDSLWVDEEVLGCACNTWILTGERSNEDSWFAVIIELPVKRALGTDCGLVRSNLGVDWLIWL